MCGPIVAALSLSSGENSKGPVFHGLYNLGRITTYTLLGLLLGMAGAMFLKGGQMMGITRGLLLLSDVFVILIGFGTLFAVGWLNIMKLEMVDTAPLISRALIKLRSLPPVLYAYSAGLLFGFLPCGFLYAAFLVSAQTAEPMKGAVVMFAFGLGTAPALVLFGSAAHWLSHRLRGLMLQAAGVAVILMGAYNMLKHLKKFGMI
jgi:sulfite exporter TauE/SafE